MKSKNKIKFTIKRKKEKPWFKKKIPGDHRVRFYHDSKNGHPFMSISKNGNFYYGHEMTTHPSLTKAGKPRAMYVQFKKNPMPARKTKSYYRKTVKKIYSRNCSKPRLSRRKWTLSKKDLKRLRRVDKNKIKNVRLATD